MSGDSAGVPWAGRELAPNPFAGDSGEAPRALLAALRAVAEAPLDPHRHRAVLGALREARLFVPIIAEAVETSVNDDGLMEDNSSEMAMVRLAASDGRETLPGFTDIPSLTSWRDGARPVPVESERLALSAVEDGDSLVILDAGTPHAFLLRRPALWAFAQGGDWAPPWADAEVAARFASVAARVGGLDSLSVRPGSAKVATEGPEIGVVLTPGAGFDGERLGAFRRAVAADELLTSRVDSLVIAIA